MDNLVIGHALESCTKDVESYDMELDGETVRLIDTPGFDDTYRSDTDILELLANWLQTNYFKGVMLTGVILLQPINANRIQGSERKRLRLFEKICGPEVFSKVVIATTMWDEIRCPEDAMQRMEMRTVSEGIWGQMVGSGARVERHDDNQESARRIVSMLCGESKPLELLMQKELLHNGGALVKTSAGIQLNSELDEMNRKLRVELEGLQQEQKKQGREVMALVEERKALDLKLRNIEQEKERLETSQTRRERSEEDSAAEGAAFSYLGYLYSLLT
ncbi:uncharacterized protein LTHEOB_12878 [Lasiodiplodia theobromae]|uniref:uncharacterized protein n=1 Tax=Lasiodiplodia theobromae TaxID=45133 RepID=UPI0015C40650|nr:uncharacterized protein LTHEOB_12878 [Lasiodiplodia theobromae]KAF4534690.1 hypothetical protein LTHEOB_12878 [Lasiodiplodia theobromae]